MSEKKDIKVLIGGKVMTMSGYEREEYMQKVATYINNKIDEYDSMASFRGASQDIKHRLLEINIADDYFKARDRVKELEKEIKIKNNELDDIKHDSVNKAMMADEMKKKLEQAKAELQESEKKVIQLQTELKGRQNAGSSRK